ncbi:MAG: methylmalonyl-CoA carboxyltransferase [Clostridiales Family XIII bacterium]|jgi:acetyl-CoA carboxylase carboxyltransferase component|nr:methylmalonyl-CoA carboxyltransferase [Clostridiales Family XIII bacterium]
MANTRLEDLRNRKAKIMLGGGAESVASQHDKGKKTARERLTLLFDPDSFVELGGFVSSRYEEQDASSESLAGDGVITGYGTIDGRLVYAYAQDHTVLEGALGERHANKIVKIQQLALKAGAPIVTIHDSGGIRLREGIDALAGYGKIFHQDTIASGVIPQISVIMGTCAGSAVFGTAISDFIILEDASAQMFVTGPQVVQSVTGTEITADALGGAKTHSAISGVAHIVKSGEVETLAAVKELLSYLPSNNLEFPPREDSADDINRLSAELNGIISEEDTESYEVYDVIKQIADDGKVLDILPDFAQNIVTCFVRIDGNAVGVVANRVKEKSGMIDIDAANKAARFVRRCDAFNIPLLTLVDAVGFLPSVEQEKHGVILHGAKLLYAFCEATVPKVTVVLRKALGSAYNIMCSHEAGADIVLAWPTAEIGVMDAASAAAIVFANEIKNATDPIAERAAKTLQYKTEINNPYRAAEAGYVDDVIEPSQTRQRLSSAFDMLASKRESLPAKKHGNIPL